MPATTHQVERLSLTFRAETPAPRSVLPGGWWLWCLLGIAIGLGGWLVSRQFLAQRLSEQLLTAKSRPEAMLALEGLLLLDSTANNAIVAGLQNEDFAIARAAFRAIDAQVERWQKLELKVAKSRMESLAKSLQELPPTTPPDNLILASSLATRMYTLCLERDDESLASTMLLCQQVIERMGKGTIEANADEATERIASLSDSNFSLADDTNQPSDVAVPATVEEYTSDSANGETGYEGGSQYTGSLSDSDPVSVPPPPLPPETNSSATITDGAQPRAPQIVDPTPPDTLSIDGMQELSSTGGRASLRLIASPVRSSLSDSNSSLDDQRGNSGESMKLVLPPAASQLGRVNCPRRRASRLNQLNPSQMNPAQRCWLESTSFRFRSWCVYLVVFNQRLRRRRH